ncbi:MAG: hypothetical protein ACR2P3_02325 [Geminicoccaceae bacterium]
MSDQLYADPSLVPRHFGLDRKIERVVVVMPGYAAEGSARRLGEGHFLCRCLGFLWRALTMESYRSFVRGYRDFYANPRSSNYMAARLSALMDNAFPEADLLLLAVDVPSLPEPLSPWQDTIEMIPVPSAQDLRATLERSAKDVSFDVALLLHHDAIGLGLARLEKTLLEAAPGRTFVMNGRRRVYRLDRKMEQRLAWRRFLAETRIAELGLSLVIGIAARFSGRRQASA